MMGKTINELKLGDKAQFSKTISESDIYFYAIVTGDLNPIHINEEYAKGTIFGERIAHGLLPAGLISTVMGTRLPGPGGVYVRQELAPVKMGDTLTATAEVVEIIYERNRVRLKTTCVNQEGKVVLDGEAFVSPPKSGPK